MALIPVSTSLHYLSQGKVVKRTYNWTLDNFTSCYIGTRKKITSPIFPIEVIDNTVLKWCIATYTEGVYSDEYLSFHISLMLESCESDVCVKCTVSLLNIKMEKEHVTTTKNVIDKSEQIHHLVFDKFITLQRLLDEANTLLPEDNLTIHCEIEVNEGRIHLNHDEIVPIKAPTPRFLDALGKAFDDKTFSDVMLVADGKEIQAHKLILAARSPVFAAMFQHQMKEQKSNHVDITDINHEVLTEMLRFMYTDSAPNVDKMAGDLLVAADKYALDSLKELCVEALYKSISVETAAETLVLADRHSAKGLKARTIAFINTHHATEVISTAGWQSMVPAHPHLVAEVLQALAIQQQQHLPRYN